mmetsp:Transcript_4905/g.12676  ORF Transcript_4905/g.12676 Transcript_4905/m.12676 type:complete len:270 (+) Transcript_4905:668-1477(+)
MTPSRRTPRASSTTSRNTTEPRPQAAPKHANNSAHLHHADGARSAAPSRPLARARDRRRRSISYSKMRCVQRLQAMARAGAGPGRGGLPRARAREVEGGVSLLYVVDVVDVVLSPWTHVASTTWAVFSFLFQQCPRCRSCQRVDARKHALGGQLVLQPDQQLEQVGESRRRGLGLRRQDGGVELARHLLAVRRVEKVPHRGSRLVRECQQRHCLFKFIQQRGVVVRKGCQLLLSERKGFVDPVVSDQLNQPLQLQPEEELGCRVQNLRV